MKTITDHELYQLAEEWTKNTQYTGGVKKVFVVFAAGYRLAEKTQHEMQIIKTKRAESACRRFIFESVKSIGVYWLISKIPGLQIKEPWKKLYSRSKRNNFSSK